MTTEDELSYLPVSVVRIGDNDKRTVDVEDKCRRINARRYSVPREHRSIRRHLVVPAPRPDLWLVRIGRQTFGRRQDFSSFVE
ncbi:hypothetical protein LBW46_22855 [Ralstonia solanacearum]|uniref:hypothetical protein n=1 Tax=Ralstonia solanacearum TaxID=305 RepID=UPI002305C991|nr:hypothetical protein [Ralstonia solanacearum]MDB0553869.1 hypothetical protein [Ralstonia solanacearum]